jgi:hypothetical protein
MVLCRHTQRHQPTTPGAETIPTECANHELIDGMVSAPGVLELSRTGTYEEYPYQEFHKYRAPVLLLVLRFIGIRHIPVTYR